MCGLQDGRGDQPPWGSGPRFSLVERAAGLVTLVAGKTPSLYKLLLRCLLHLRYFQDLRYFQGVQQIRTITSDELSRVHEVDVSEQTNAVFVQHGTSLEQVVRPHNRAWLSEQDWSPGVRLWQAFLQAGGAAFGAFDDDKLIGFAVLRTRLTADTDQLAGLYIDRAFRRQGVARGLVDRVVNRALDGGALNLYVSAAPSVAAVSFYLDCGFTPVAEPNAELFVFEPKDIHMSMVL
jgi:GNAT superfamily N-acetyltransferase